jgi:mannose-6-phosphate isomerase
MSIPIYPLLFAPVYKDYLWGGGRIPRFFRNKPGHAGTCAESWEIADRPEGMSIVTNGPAKGKSLHALVETLGQRLVGTAAKSKVFPLLIKIIDARERLSVQVHPDEHTAVACNGEAKTEMWYALAAEHGAHVFAGFLPGTDRNSFETALTAKRVEKVLRDLPITIDEAIFIPGGRVHAIGEGCLLLEVQQNSNTTYRVHDWDRVDKDGKPRELHLEKALQVINWTDDNAGIVKPQKLSDEGGNNIWQIVKCPFFNVVRIDLKKKLVVRNDGLSFHVLFVAEGQMKVEANGVVENISAGTSCLIPAALETYSITPVSGAATVIRTTLV